MSGNTIVIQIRTTTPGIALLASLKCPDRGLSTFSHAKLNAISRIITSPLRRNGLRRGLEISEDGFTSVNKLLELKELKTINITLTTADIRELVRINNKQRFSLTIDESTGEEMIRANQVHSQGDGMAKINLSRLCGGAILHLGPGEECCHATYTA